MDKIITQDCWIKAKGGRVKAFDPFLKVFVGESLEKHTDLYVHSPSQLKDIIEEAFEAGRIHALTGERPGKDEYIESLLNED